MEACASRGPSTISAKNNIGLRRPQTTTDDRGLAQRDTDLRVLWLSPSLCSVFLSVVIRAISGHLALPVDDCATIVGYGAAEGIQESGEG